MSDIEKENKMGFRLATYSVLGIPRPHRIVELRDAGWEPVYSDLRLFGNTGMILIKKIA